VHERHAIYVGDQAEIALSGLLLPKEKYFDDKEIDVIHHSPKGKSHQMFYSVGRDHGKAVFHGRAIVKHSAPGTDARQLAHALMLSDNCQIFSRPELEIDIDDVQCQHGSSVGQIDEKSLLYLRSRGIPYELAKNMIICGFIEEVILKLPSEWQEWIHQRIKLHGFSI
jgi:Fe-S cluster assembly protein SufD